MSLRCRYHPREDRMLLTIGTGEAEMGFWVTRSLWLALYRHLAAALPREERPGPMPSTASSARRRDEPDRTNDAVLLEAISWKHRKEAVTLVLRSAKPAVTLTLDGEAISRMRRMLEAQAERAGWDPAAALERLRAQELAKAALRRASE